MTEVPKLGALREVARDNIDVIDRLLQATNILTV